MNQLSNKNASGTLDPSFGESGVVMLSSGSRSIASLRDNKLIVAGAPAAGQLLLTRLTEKGGLDLSFGVGGEVHVPGMGRTGFIPSKIIALENGGYLVSGSEAVYSTKKYVCRLFENGQLDQSFGTDGMVTIPASSISGDEIEQGARFVEGFGLHSNADVTFFSSDKMAVSERNAKVYLCAHIYSGVRGFEGVVFCLNEDGSIDASFNGGYVLIPIDFGSNMRLTSISVQDDAVLIGGGFVSASGTREVAFLKRYDQQGHLDTLFGERGTVIIPNGTDGRTSIITSVVIREDGLIVASGESGKLDEREGLLAVFNPNGSFNRVFNNGRPLYDAFLRDLVFSSSVLQQGTKIIVTGSGNGDYMVAARYELNGSLDLSFGGKGWVVFDPIHGLPVATSESTSDNKITVHLGSGWETKAVRYLE
ncbi:hypothetical protein [Pseudomonas fluorescens]|uniref:Delta-60 repeat domain-containing protein n=1 Tax=Pseudomonas fluorescens TaxID=294 RepID=A0A5E6SXK6_PSEFL|nr:hypothetical protein [Pseudomonas fluorescens]VVM80528.1 hypothetical protein PS659_02319 [Pseudomonas fluorescens]